MGKGNSNFHNSHSKGKAQNKNKQGPKKSFDYKSLLIFHLNSLFDHDIKPVHFDMTDYILIVFITVISLTTHLLKIGHPAKVVFDEVYFGNFTNHYQRGEYYFDIHPPLGKLILYFGSVISGYQALEDYTNIDAPHDRNDLIKIRMWPSLFGALRAPFLYIFLRLFECGPQWCFTVALFISLDNALIVESRFVLIDAFLSFFAILTLMWSAYITRKPRNAYLIAILGGLAAGATVSIKFTGAGVALTLVLAIFVTYPLFDAIKLSFVSALSGVFLFVLQFFVHFILLPNNGPGCLYTPIICQERKNIKTFSFVQNTLQLLKTMWLANMNINVSHVYSSKWWQWPLMLGKGTYMWVEKDMQLWCVGSPVVWYSGLVSLAIWIVQFIKNPKSRKTIYIFIGYLISYLPFFFVQRVMYNYHYFIPLIYSLSAGAYGLSNFCPNAYVLPAILCVAAFITYYIYFPITYGTPLPYNQFKKIMFPCWIYH